MTRLKYLVCFYLLIIGYVSSAIAAQYDWLKELELSAKADPSGYMLELATRFKIGDVEVKSVLSEVKNYSDAYMVLKLGELADQQTDTVIEYYNSRKNKGWGALARQLGIKPGSREFHALKRGHDLNLDTSDSEDYKGKGKSKGNSKGKGKAHNKGNKN